MNSFDREFALKNHLVRGNVILIGGYGVGNYGDEAILSGLLNMLPSRSRKIVVSHDPLETEEIHHVNSIYPVEVLRALTKADAVITSGGLYSGDMGTFGKFVPIFAVFSRTVGVKIVYLGLGVYPDMPMLLGPLIKASMKVASDVGVRDKLSKWTLERMGVRKVFLMRDLSFSAVPAPPYKAVRILEEEGVDLTRDIIGISITRTNPALTAKVASAIREVIRRLGGEFEILMLPMCRHKRMKGENDFLYSKEVTQGFSDVKILQGTYHPSEILSIFGILKVSICMRLHSMIFSHRMGVHMIPIPYAKKCEDFLREIGVKPIEPKQDEIVRRIQMMPVRGKI